ncbi:hypothetical protein F5Y15DRAFT_405052 [Xylariaceae sp. FL0016]|nr:hypothetical protein F5Y15DRAFT_405052 [Xylariaceae sp. FL0016]
MPPPLPDSSPDSFVTAVASSPISDPPDSDKSCSSDARVQALEAQYRKAMRLPPELSEHCRVYFEESLHPSALYFLNSILTSRSDDPQTPVFCPPPSQLSLLLSTAVHPSFSTRPKETDWPRLATDCIIYARSLLKLLGPIDGGFRESTRFESPRGTSPDSYFGAEDEDERGRIRLLGQFARDSVWRRGRDFFSVVGWAFNCSVLYPDRWRYWRNWLDFMTELLQNDLEERLRLDNENGDEDMTQLRDSILAGYIAQRSGRSGIGIKWIMKTIFADGSKSASSLFQEIWHKEHKGSSVQAMNKRKRDKVNIESGDFGAWMENESVYSSQASEPPTPQKRRTNSANLDQNDFQALEPAFVESIPLRQRLFSMLSYLCYHLSQPPLDFTELYESFETTIKQLPLPIFTAFINGTTSTLRPEVQVTVMRNVTELFMPSNALSLEKVDRAKAESGAVTPEIIERCFLPYPANTVTAEDNAKVSALLEELLRLPLDDTESFSHGLSAAVEKGVKAREAKARKKKTRGNYGGDDPDAEARTVLEMSGQRLLLMAEMIAELSEAADDDEMSEDDIA